MVNSTGLKLITRYNSVACNITTAVRCYYLCLQVFPEFRLTGQINKDKSAYECP